MSEKKGSKRKPKQISSTGNVAINIGDFTTDSESFATTTTTADQSQSRNLPTSTENTTSASTTENPLQPWADSSPFTSTPFKGKPNQSSKSNRVESSVDTSAAESDSSESTSAGPSSSTITTATLVSSKGRVKSKKGKKKTPTASYLHTSGVDNSKGGTSPLIRTTKFNKQGILRKKLERSDPLYRERKGNNSGAVSEEQSLSLKPKAEHVIFPELSDPSKKDSLSATPEVDPSASKSPRKRIQKEKSWVERNIIATRGKQLPELKVDKKKNKIKKMSNPELPISESVAEIGEKAMTNSKSKESVRGSGGKGMKNSKSKESVRGSEGQSRQSTKPTTKRASVDQEKRVTTILPPKTALRRTDAQDHIPEGMAGQHLYKQSFYHHGVVRENPVLHSVGHKGATKVTKSETQARKDFFDGMIHTMIDQEDDDTDEDEFLDSASRRGTYRPNKFHEYSKIRNSLRNFIPKKRKAGDTSTEDGRTTYHSVTVSKLKSERNIGKVREMIRVRAKNRPSVHYNFTSFDSNAQDELDPIGTEGVIAAGNYTRWSQQARMSLPSKVGVQIQRTDDVVNAGFPAVDLDGRHDYDAKTAYHKIFDAMHKHLDQDELNLEGEDTKHEDKMGDIDDEKSLTVTKKVSALKLVADHLHKKRQLKRDLIEDGKARNILQKEERSIKAILGRSVKTVQLAFHDFVKSCTIWRQEINSVHGKFGLMAATYFRWLRTIVVMNTFYFFVSLCLVILPEIYMDSTGPTFPNSNWTWSSCPKNPFKGILNCNGVQEDPPVYPVREQFEFMDLFIGHGIFERSYLFYSGYRDTSANISCPSVKANKLPFTSPFQVTGLRFLLTSFIIFIVNSVYVAVQIVRFFHVARLESKIPGMVQKDQFKSVLCAWDFSCANEAAAKALHAGIFRELKEMSEGFKHAKSTLIKAADDRLFVWFIKHFGKKNGAKILHWVSNIGVVLACLVSGVIIYGSIYIRTVWTHSCSGNRKLELPNVLLVLPALFISIATYGMTKLCVIISKYEAWTSSENRNFVLVARVGLFYITNIGVLYVYWWSDTKEGEEPLCYETIFGQELYRLVVFQGIIQLIYPFAYSIIKDWMKRRSDPMYKKPEFDSATDALNAFFLHTIGGIGFFFSPMISLIIVIRLVGTFYHRKYTLTHLTSFPSHIVHMSEVAAPYLTTFFISYLLTSFLNVLLFADLGPAAVCGPFMHFASHKHYWYVFTEGFTETTLGVFKFVTKPGLAIVVIVILLSICYVLRAWANAYVTTIENIHDMLLLERKDREFLLRAVFKLVKRQADEAHGIVRVDEEGEVDDNFLLDDEDDEDVGMKKISNWRQSEMSKVIFSARRGSMAAETGFGPMRRKHTSLIRRSQMFHAVLKAAVKPKVNHHATFRRESVDHWLKKFLKSKRAKRRDAVATLTEEEEEDIRNKYGMDKKDDDKLERELDEG